MTVEGRELHGEYIIPIRLQYASTIHPVVTYLLCIVMSKETLIVHARD